MAFPTGSSPSTPACPVLPYSAVPLLLFAFTLPSILLLQADRGICFGWNGWDGWTLNKTGFWFLHLIPQTFQTETGRKGLMGDLKGEGVTGGAWPGLYS